MTYITMKKVLLLFSFFVCPFLSQSQDSKLFDEGVAKFKAGEYNAVIDLFTQILSDPDHNKRLNEDLYFYRGQSYFHTGNARDALADLEESLKLNHYNKPVIHWFKARCAEKLDDFAGAEASYNEALNLSSGNRKVHARILADRAGYFARRGNAVAARQDLEQARTLDPNNAEIAATDLKNIKTTMDSGKETKVIVKNNTQAKPAVEEAPKTSGTANKPAEKPAQPVREDNSSVAMISKLAEAYKDEKRYALVIGNSNYSKEIGTLKNPVNDATDVASELRKSNFEVQLLTNATYIQIREAMRKFQERLTEGPKDQTVGLFYYAGHGVQYQDENYLVPVDANVKYEDDIVRMCFPVQRMVLANMEKTNSRMNIIILDACRNNPFPATTRSVSQGLGEMRRARGSFIAYATAPGSVASDGQGRNGLYTQELLKALRKPGLTIEQVFKEVRQNVLRLSGDKQFTWDSSNIIGEFYFKF
jgi:Uncharacterized protein containing caspase domain